MRCHVQRAGRRAGLTAAAVVTALTLSSCLVLPFVPRDEPTGGDGGSATTATGAGRTPPPDQPQLAPYYAQTVQWRGCSGGECATLKVPVSYADPTGLTMELALLRVKARNSGERIGSLVVNPGGPGASGVEYAGFADQIVGSNVRRRFDIVGFDPRGVGASAPLDCLSDKDLDEFLAMDPSPDDPAESTEFVEQSKSLAEGCQKGGGALLAHLSTEEVARDVDILRAALGEPRLHFLGASYGTYIGSIYADLFPANVGRFVLDGAVAPDLTSAEVSEGQARGFELATRAYVQSCVSRGNCPVGGSLDEGMEWIRNFLKGLDSQPLRVTDDARVTELTEGWGIIGMAAAMYSQQDWPRLSAALADAKNGDGNALMELAGQYARRTPSGRFTSNIMEVIYAVNCLDSPGTADLNVVAQNAAAFEKTAPTWGRFLAWGSVVCGVWPIQSGRTPKRVSADGSQPIVVVGTTRDPATIYEWSVRLRQQLSNASLVTYDGDGHTAYRRSNACVDNAIDAYFVDGTVPKDGLAC